MSVGSQDNCQVSVNQPNKEETNLGKHPFHANRLARRHLARLPLRRQRGLKRQTR